MAASLSISTRAHLTTAWFTCCVCTAEQNMIALLAAVEARMDSILQEIEPETAARLAVQAKAQGLSVDAYLRSLLPDEKDRSRPRPLYETKAREGLARAFVEWTKSYSVKGVIADDSRESIYVREDEVL